MQNKNKTIKENGNNTRRNTRTNEQNRNKRS